MASVYVFGSGDCGQLGLGEDVESRKKPTILPFLEDKNIIDVVAGGLHSLALGADGRVYSWGCNDEKALGRKGEEYEVAQVDGFGSHKIVQIAAGDSISAGLTSEGLVYTWGTFRDSKGVIGFDSKSVMQEMPTLMESLKNEKIVEIAAGANHMIAITKDSRLFTWGCGEQGQLGRRILERHKTNALAPSNITPGKRRKQNQLEKVACGSYHSLAISSEKELYSWGLNNYGQLGQDSTEETNRPVLAETDEKVVAIEAGEHHSIFLNEKGFVFSAGRGDSGQLGRANETHSTTFRKIEKLSKIKMIASGGNHSLAVNDKNEVFSWGFGGMLQLGTGLDDDVFEPVKINFQSSKVLKVQAGGQHSIILAMK